MQGGGNQIDNRPGSHLDCIVGRNNTNSQMTFLSYMRLAGFQLQSQVLTHIHEQYTDPELSITAVSAAFGRSERQIARFLKSRTGTTLTFYIRQLRMQRAQDLLLRSDISIKAISLNVGYTNISRFNRHFRKTTGLTPSGFRKRILDLR